MLLIDDLEVTYRGLYALQHISLQVQAGELVVVIGANGAGKTTLLKSLAGAVPLQRGRILYKGHDITRVPGHTRAAMGMAHVPTGRGKVFPTLSVMENLILGSYRRLARQQRRTSLHMVFQLFPVLYERRRQAAGTLHRGEQHMLALSRALMLCPDLLLLDEPSLGLSPHMVDTIFDGIVRIRSPQLAIVLAEQHVVEALELCDRGYVLEAGRLVLAGSREVLLGDARVRRASWEI